MTVYVLGSLNEDLVINADRHPQPGETVAGTSLDTFVGGKGLNQAVAAVRAGAHTVMIGAVGNDEAGRRLCEALVADGVDTGRVRSVDAMATGRALITVAGAENTIVVVAGANAALDTELIAGVDWTPSDVLVAQYETPVPLTLEAFGRAAAGGTTTVLNPAPGGPVDRELLALTDVLVVNEHEFSLVFGVPVDWEDPLHTEFSLQLAGDMFEGALIVTLGSRGALLASGRTSTSGGVVGEFRVAGVPVSAVDSTGSGDCFVGYLAAGLARGAPLEEIVVDANAAAALSVTRVGAARSIPHRAELPTSC